MTDISVILVQKGQHMYVTYKYKKKTLPPLVFGSICYIEKCFLISRHRTKFISVVKSKYWIRVPYTRLAFLLERSPCLSIGESLSSVYQFLLQQFMLTTLGDATWAEKHHEGYWNKHVKSSLVIFPTKCRIFLAYNT